MTVSADEDEGYLGSIQLLSIHKSAQYLSVWIWAHVQVCMTDQITLMTFFSFIVGLEGP